METHEKSSKVGTKLQQLVKFGTILKVEEAFQLVDLLADQCGGFLLWFYLSVCKSGKIKSCQDLVEESDGISDKKLLWILQILKT